MHALDIGGLVQQFQPLTCGFSHLESPKEQLSRLGDYDVVLGISGKDFCKAEIILDRCMSTLPVELIWDEIISLSIAIIRRIFIN